MIRVSKPVREVIKANYLARKRELAYVSKHHNAPQWAIDGFWVAYVKAKAIGYAA